MQKLAVGTRIYYTGDMANQPDEGTVVAVRPPDRWGGESYDICLDDGRTMRGIYPSNYSGPGKRFWTLDEWEADRQRRIDEANAAYHAATGD